MTAMGLSKKENDGEVRKKYPLTHPLLACPPPSPNDANVFNDNVN